jgi:hypothetical protein
VIVGFQAYVPAKRMLFIYDSVKGEPLEVAASRINGYLVDAPNYFLENRSAPICNVAPRIGIGNKPIDGGHYLFTEKEMKAFIEAEPKSEKWFRRWLGADEFINGFSRWCLWLGECPPSELRQMPKVIERVNAVRQVRLASKSAPTRKIADTPTRFHVEFIPDTPYMVIPEVSSERRKYIPLGFLEPSTLASNKLRLAPGATLYHFGMLQSVMHMTWTNYTCGRLESRYQYSIGLVYNNYPWPENPSEKHIKSVEVAAQNVLDVRSKYPDNNLADLYDPLAMPSELVNAHGALDKAVDLCYRSNPFPNEAKRMEFLFELYDKYTAGMFAVNSVKQKKANNPKH